MINANHSLIVGRTRTGKTTLAKVLVANAVSRGKNVCVLDPIHSVWKGVGFQSANPQEFLDHVKTTKDGSLVVVDEAGISIGKYDAEMNWLTTTSRHLGHSAILICHQYSQLSTTIRSQCTVLYVFASNFSSIKLLVDEYPHLTDKINQVMQYESGFFLRIMNNRADRFRVDFASKQIFSLDAIHQT
jgi:hypothetical protein